MINIGWPMVKIEMASYVITFFLWIFVISTKMRNSTVEMKIILSFHGTTGLNLHASKFMK